MAVCKFFLEGNCRYGQRCRYKHVYYEGRDNYYGYDEQDYNHNQTRQANTKGFSGVSILRANRNDNPSFTPIQNSNYNAPASFGSFTSSSYSTNTSNSQRGNPQNQLIQDLLTAILKELEASEHGHQWPLSCCCPIIRETVNIPGWVDHSPEELRWEIYKSTKDGTFEQCKISIQQLFREAQERRNDFKSREKAVSIIEKMLEMKRISSSAFTNSATDNGFSTLNNNFSGSNIDSPSPAFSAVTIPPQPQPFTSGLGTPSVAAAPQTRLFSDPAPAFSFSLNQNNNSTCDNTSNIISTSVAPPPQLFTNPLFPQNNSQPIFNEPSAAITVADNNLCNFSNLSELTETELNAYQAETFEFGKVPLKPPSKELCMYKVV